MGVPTVGAGARGDPVGQTQLVYGEDRLHACALSLPGPEKPIAIFAS
jgi:hypothetical protein